jgi:hypothetical protein
MYPSPHHLPPCGSFTGTNAGATPRGPNVRITQPPRRCRRIAAACRVARPLYMSSRHPSSLGTVHSTLAGSLLSHRYSVNSRRCLFESLHKPEILGCVCVVFLGSKVGRILRKRMWTKKMRVMGKQRSRCYSSLNGLLLAQLPTTRLVWSSELSRCMSLGAPYPEFPPAVPRGVFARIIV